MVILCHFSLWFNLLLSKLTDSIQDTILFSNSLESFNIPVLINLLKHFSIAIQYKLWLKSKFLSFMNLIVLSVFDFLNQLFNSFYDIQLLLIIFFSFILIVHHILCHSHHLSGFVSIRTIKFKEKKLILKIQERLVNSSFFSFLKFNICSPLISLGCVFSTVLRLL